MKLDRWWFLLGAVILGGVAMTVVLRVFYAAPVPPDLNPLRYTNPQIVLGSHVLHQGQEFQVQRTKCNIGDEPVAVLTNSTWRQINPDGSSERGIPYRSSTVPLVIPAHDCNERPAVNMIPLNLPDCRSLLPDCRWLLEGVDCITPVLAWCREWHTETFEVIP